MVVRVKTKRGAKIPFKQSEYDRLVTRGARASLALKRARQDIADYEKTHTTGLPRLSRGDKWI